MTLKETLNSKDRFAYNTGAQLTEIRKGYAKAELDVEEKHLNGADVCQGGVLFTLADLAFAAVTNGENILSLGVSNTITFLKSAHLNDHLIAECCEIHSHKKLPYCNIQIKNQKGELIAVMTGLAYRLSQEFHFSSYM